MATIKTGTLMAYDTAETIREAAEAETVASIVHGEWVSVEVQDDAA